MLTTIRTILSLTGGKFPEHHIKKRQNRDITNHHFLMGLRETCVAVEVSIFFDFGFRTLKPFPNHSLNSEEF